VSGKHASSKISPALQKIIWNLPPSATNHFPGKLSLCIGMPVIIRNNDATELCITKGREGHVMGWQAGITWPTCLGHTFYQTGQICKNSYN
jgi:hypothetical protein